MSPHHPHRESDEAESDFRGHRNSWGWIKKTVVILAVLSSFVTAVIAHETRYAKAGDIDGIKQEVRNLYQDLRLGQLHSARRDLIREEYDLALTAQKRALSDLERTRFTTVRQERTDITEQIDLCRKDMSQCRPR